MEDLKGKERVLRRKREWDYEPLVPYRLGGAGIIRLSGQTTVRINPEDTIRFQITLTPVNVFEMLSRDDSNVEVVEL